jgi:hypothetical protein
MNLFDEILSTALIEQIFIELVHTEKVFGHLILSCIKSEFDKGFVADLWIFVLEFPDDFVTTAECFDFHYQ